MVNFPTQIPNCNSHCPALLDLLFFLTLVFVLQWFLSIGKFWSCSCLSSYWLSIKLKRGCPISSHNYSSADWDGFCNHLRNVPWEDIFKLYASAAASKCCEWFQDRIDVYISHGKHQVKPHSSPWFSASCAVPIAHRNHLFHLYQQNKSSESKVMFRQAINCCKRVLEASIPAYANEIKDHFPEILLWGLLPNSQQW